jgi:hypothetical protein
LIVADSGDSALDTTVYIASLGGVPPAPIDVEVLASNGDSVFVVSKSDADDRRAGEQAFFDAKLVGDGQAHAFDLIFRDAADPGRVFGSIPIRVSATYVSAVTAVDADEDEVSYAFVNPAGERVATLHGATIGDATGVVTWEPDVAGTDTFVVEAFDGRGGVDRETYDVDVAATNTGNQLPVIANEAPEVAVVGPTVPTRRVYERC